MRKEGVSRRWKANKRQFRNHIKLTRKKTINQKANEKTLEKREELKKEKVFSKERNLM